MSNESTNKALDRLQRRARLRVFALVAALLALPVTYMVVVSNKSEAEFRFVKVVGSRFQADDSGPRWRIEVLVDDRVRYVSTARHPGPLSEGQYICVNVKVSPGFGTGGLGLLPDGICNQNGVYAPET